MIRFFDYIKNEEKELSKEFIEQGYIIRDITNLELLDEICNVITDFLLVSLRCELIKNRENFLNNFHKNIKTEQLNDIRLSTFHHINNLDWFHPSFYHIGSEIINQLVGNELAMQKQVNLSIQMPEDETSILGMHSDIYSGESPYQVNQWLPLVDCYSTKSMYILPPQKNAEVIENFHEYEVDGMDKIFNDYQKDLVWINIMYGQVMIFNSNLLHGNVINDTKETRFSLNTRYKGLFSPYNKEGKGLGSFYIPITTKAATQIGLKFNEPRLFNNKS